MVGQLIVTIPTMISTIFEGLFINIDTLPVYLQWLPYIALSRYPTEMLSTNEMADLVFYGNVTVYGISEERPVNGSDLLRDQGVPTDRASIWENEGILLGASFVMFALTYFQLTKIKKRK